MHAWQQRWLVVGLVMAVVQPTWAAVGDCGTVTAYGSCYRDVLTYCDAPGTPREQKVTLNCTTEVFPAGVAGVCTLINATYGYDCAVAQGNRCTFVDESNEVVVAYCEGTRPGCVLDPATNNSTCASGVGTCVVPEGGQSFVPTCGLNNILEIGCQETQPIGIDCAALGGTCQNGVCNNVTAGKPCDELKRCATGLTCDDHTHTCVVPADICDPQTHHSTCSDSNTLLYCDSETHLRTRFDCTTVLGETGNTSCGPEYSCVDDGTSKACGAVGSGCIGRSEGSACRVEDGIYCTDGLGCVMGLGPNGSGHVERCTTTATCAFGEPDRGCVGNMATFCVSGPTVTVKDAAAFDCTTFGSICTDDPVLGPICVGQEGARCDDVVAFPDTPFRCAAGLTCVMTSTQFGYCRVPAPDAGTRPDAAVVDADGGTPVADAGGVDGGGTTVGDASTDAGVQDAAVTAMDASSDAGAVVAADGGDAGLVAVDGSVVASDSGIASTDGSVSSSSSSSTPPGDDDDDDSGTGCGCATSQAERPLVLLWLGMLVLGIARRCRR